MKHISKKKFLHVAIIFSILLISSSLSWALQPQITISENSKNTLLLNGNYNLEADGQISIYNPSNVSRIMEFRIPITLDALIGINKKDIDATSAKFDFSFDEINGYIIEPQETITVGYHIYGLLSYDIYNYTNSNISVFEYYADSFNLYTQTVVNLQKPTREQENTTNQSQRLISAGIRNPTDFDLFINDLNIYKTSVSDPFFNNGVLLKSFANISVDPFGMGEVEVFDTSSTSNSVYWVSTDVNIQNNISTSLTESFTKQKPPESSGGGSGGGGSSGGGASWPNLDPTNNQTPQINETDFDDLLIKKSVDKTIVQNGEDVIVTLRIVNVNEDPVYNLSIEDIIPENYNIRNISENVKIENDIFLKFNIDKVEAYDTYVITYTLKNEDNIKGITYLKPAKLMYLNMTYFSDGVLLINELLPEKKVFIQKEVRYVDENFAKVIIRVKNLGSVELKNLLVSDNIDENSIIKDISKIFSERGVWNIKSLKAGEEWEVSYLIERNANIDTLPNIFGVDNSNVFGTMISSEEVITVFKEPPRTIEKVGMVIAVSLLIIYLLF